LVVCLDDDTVLYQEDVTKWDWLQYSVELTSENASNATLAEEACLYGDGDIYFHDPIGCDHSTLPDPVKVVDGEHYYDDSYERPIYQAVQDGKKPCPFCMTFK
jgi:hypothetical protein